MTADRRKRHLKILEVISTRAVHTRLIHRHIGNKDDYLK